MGVRSMVFVLVVASACDEHATVPAPTGAAAATSLGAASSNVRVMLGDCTDSPVPFVSGPQPQWPHDVPAAPGQVFGVRPDRGEVAARVGRERGVPGARGIVRLGKPLVTGSSSAGYATTVTRYVARQQSEIAGCYTRRLQAHSFDGTFTLTFALLPSGDVAWVRTAGVDDRDLVGCAVSLIEEIAFPAPKARVLVTFPLALVRDPRQKVTLPVATEHLATEPEDRAASRTPPPFDADYQPGSTNPLAAVSGAIGRCVATAGAPPVALVVNGTAGGMEIHGTDNRELIACLRTAMHSVAVANVGKRCGLAAGVLEPGKATGIDVTRDAISFATTSVPVAELPASLDVPLRPLEAALSTRTRELIERPPAIAQHGPLVLRATRDAPIAAVTHAAYTAVRGGEDVVLAAQRANDDSWELLGRATLPVVPVPLGTGAAWSPDPRWDLRVDGSGVSLLVRPGTFWIGTTPGDKGRTIPSNDHARLQSLLRETTTWAKHVEVAGEGVTWFDVVVALDLAYAAGLERRTLTAPEGLAAQPPR